MVFSPWYRTRLVPELGPKTKSQSILAYSQPIASKQPSSEWHTPVPIAAGLIRWTMFSAHRAMHAMVLLTGNRLVAVLATILLKDSVFRTLDDCVSAACPSVFTFRPVRNCVVGTILEYDTLESMSIEPAGGTSASTPKLKHVPGLTSILQLGFASFHEPSAKR